MAQEVTPQQNVMIDRQELANRWRSSVSTIKRMEVRGEIKPIKIGHRAVRFRIEEIIRYETTGRNKNAD